MAMHHAASGNGRLETFKTFPEFSKLTYSDRPEFEALTRDYPPLVDTSFIGLMLWWNQLDTCSVSRLNDNFVISYWFPGDERISGLSLVGTNRIDESICTIFDYLKERQMPVRLVHVPEMVMERIEYPDLFRCRHERNFDEYIFDISKFYPLNHLISYRRFRVQKFLSKIDEDRIHIQYIDLTKLKNQQKLLSHSWPAKGINKIVKAFDEVWQTSIEDADLLGLECIGLYMDDELQAFCLYKQMADRRYIMFRHAKVNYDIPYLIDYMIYAFARWFAEKGAMYVNLDSDSGIPFLRMFLTSLGPVNYFRKYSVEPAA